MGKQKKKHKSQRPAKTSAPEKVMECATHGRVPWGLEILCKECGACWRACEGEGRNMPPGGVECTCGARLIDEGNSGSAVPICPGCYDKYKPAVPMDVLRQTGQVH